MIIVPHICSCIHNLALILIDKDIMCSWRHRVHHRLPCHIVNCLLLQLRSLHLSIGLDPRSNYSWVIGQFLLLPYISLILTDLARSHG